MSVPTGRDQSDRRVPADLIIAAGMNPSRLGGAILRLHTEFDRSERPRPPTPEQIEAIARTILIEVPVRDQKTNKPKFKPNGDPITKMVSDLRAAEKRAWKWYVGELEFLAAKLKSLAVVAEEMTAIAMRERIDHPAATARQVIGWWLLQNCTSCTGREEEEMRGTARLSGRACGKCHGSGKTDVPHGAQGRRLANVMDECVQAARFNIKNRLRNYR
jgi:hypothetical protein